MNARQVVLSYLSATESDDPEAGAAYLADNVVFEGGAMSQRGGAADVARISKTLRVAMPDFEWNVQSLGIIGSQVIVALRWGGTHRGSLDLSGFRATSHLAPIPPTNEKIEVPDAFVFTLEGEKITVIRIASGPDEGFPEFLKQLGVTAAVSR